MATQPLMWYAKSEWIKVWTLSHKVPKAEYSGINRLIPWLTPWLSAFTSHHQPWYWQYSMKFLRFLACLEGRISTTCAISVFRRNIKCSYSLWGVQWFPVIKGHSLLGKASPYHDGVMKQIYCLDWWKINIECDVARIIQFSHFNYATHVILLIALCRVPYDIINHHRIEKSHLLCCINVLLQRTYFETRLVSV